MDAPAPLARNRVVAIVGRPNVGKSALFNRLIGRRLSIVHEQPGVTRDRVVAEGSWDGQRFELIDTGGIGYVDNASPEGVIEAGMKAQVEVAIEDAGHILFVVDVQAGLHPLDEEVARLLHRAGRPVLVLANKADNREFERLRDDFQGFGWPVFPISVLHNRGVGAAMETLLERLPPAPEHFTVADPLKVVVVGRPNAGKSTLINTLVQGERLIVSPIPGTTRDAVEIPFSVGEGDNARHYRLIDTAGLRKASKVHEAVEYFSRMRVEDSVRRADVAILLLDASEGPRMTDKKLAALIAEARKGCVVVINKWDLATGTGVTQQEYRAEFAAQLKFLDYAPLHFISAQSGLNVKKLLEVVDRVGANISFQTTTGVLNRALRDAVERNPPPMVKGKRFKLQYATQTGTRPVRFTLFVNDEERLTDSYHRYLVNTLRATFPLEGAPVVLNLESRRREDAPVRVIPTRAAAKVRARRPPPRER
jgi:GTP-binding protein